MLNKVTILRSLLGLSLVSFVAAANADSYPANGRYEARVKTEDGTYTVPVDVENGTVTAIRWPNGKKTKIRGTDLDRGEVVGRNFFGDRYKISIDDLGTKDDKVSFGNDSE